MNADNPRIRGVVHEHEDSAVEMRRDHFVLLSTVLVEVIRVHVTAFLVCPLFCFVSGNVLSTTVTNDDVYAFHSYSYSAGYSVDRCLTLIHERLYRGRYEQLSYSDGVGVDFRRGTTILEYLSECSHTLTRCGLPRCPHCAVREFIHVVCEALHTAHIQYLPSECQMLRSTRVISASMNDHSARTT